MEFDLAAEQAITAEILAEVSESARWLLSEIDIPPRSMHIQVGEVAIEIEWPEPGQDGILPQSASPENLGAHANPVPERHEPSAQRPVIAAQTAGVFYRQPEPGADPFVREGDVVTLGQQVAIIEAMKLMLPVEADRAGRIEEVLMADGDQVERGEPLFALSGTV